MKEFRFKVLLDGEKLCCFSELEMVIRTPDGKFKIYRIDGFNDGKPNFYKKSHIVDIINPTEISCSILCLKINDEYKIFKVIQVEDSLPKIDENFLLVIKSGIGKLEVHDKETEITITLPAKEAANE